MNNYCLHNNYYVFTLVVVITGIIIIVAVLVKRYKTARTSHGPTQQRSPHRSPVGAVPTEYIHRPSPVNESIYDTLDAYTTGRYVVLLFR